jgi:hypothetical protein
MKTINSQTHTHTQTGASVQSIGHFFFLFFRCLNFVHLDGLADGGVVEVVFVLVHDQSAQTALLIVFAALKQHKTTKTVRKTKQPFCFLLFAYQTP